MSSVILCCSENNDKKESAYGVLGCDFFVWYFFICGWLDPHIQKKNCINFVGIFFGVLLGRQMPRRSGLHGNLLWNPRRFAKWLHHFYTPPGKAEVYFSPSSPHLSRSVFLIIINLVRETERFHHQSPRSFKRGPARRWESCQPFCPKANPGWLWMSENRSKTFLRLRG